MYIKTMSLWGFIVKLKYFVEILQYSEIIRNLCDCTCTYWNILVVIHCVGCAEFFWLPFFVYIEFVSMILDCRVGSSKIGNTFIWGCQLFYNVTTLGYIILLKSLVNSPILTILYLHVWGVDPVILQYINRGPFEIELLVYTTDILVKSWVGGMGYNFPFASFLKLNI